MSARAAVLSFHRWLSLAIVALWTLQAATGMFAVFHWEIDDATIAGEHRPTDLRAIERTLALLTAPGAGRSVESVWTSAGAPDRWDVEIAAEPPERGLVVRVDGNGNVLRTRPEGERFAAGGIVDTLVSLHYTLLAGQTGRWIIGVSGILLLTNLLFGVMAAWPRRGQWRRTLRPPFAGDRPAGLYAWHRTLGLWLALPAMVLVSAGILLAFEHELEEALPIPAVQAPAERPEGRLRVGMADAVEAALARHPDSFLSAVVSFPDAEEPIWTLRLRQPSELRRAYGKTVVYVSAVDGSILADFDALEAPTGRRFVNALFPLHTGEMGGIPGRIAVLLVGAWLLTMIVLGVRLWLSRRRVQAARAASASRPGQ